MEKDLENKELDFERILSLSYKAALTISFRYAVDESLAEEKALDVWAENKEKVLSLAQYQADEGFESKVATEKKVYFFFKDSIRQSLGITKKVIDGKSMWYSPYMDEVTYDTNNEDYGGMEELDSITQKDIFYEHIDDFNLTKDEKLVIDLTFFGYNYRNDIDVLVFLEALGTDSPNYVKTFFNRLCKKLEAESERIGLR